MMTPRERFMAVVAGRQPDYVPWIARLVLWYNAHHKQGTLPERYRGWSLFDIHRDLRIGILGRGDVYSERLRNVEVRETRRGNEIFREYATPVGTVSTTFYTSPTLQAVDIQPYQSAHMVKRRADYAVARYIVEHTEFVAEFDKFAALQEEIGEDGVAMARICRSPFQRAMIEFVGLQQIFYELHDNPAQLEGLLAVLAEQSREIHRVAAESPADIIWSPDNFTGDLSSPALFRKHSVPYLRDLAAFMHARGKVVVSHADGDMGSLLDIFPESGVDVAESFAPAPLTSVPLEDAVRAWRGRLKIWGCIPSNLFNPGISDDGFERFMHDLFRIIAPGDGIILGIADNALPESSLERMRRVAELVDVYGKCPIVV